MSVHQEHPAQEAETGERKVRTAHRLPAFFTHDSCQQRARKSLNTFAYIIHERMILLKTDLAPKARERDFKQEKEEC